MRETFENQIIHILNYNLTLMNLLIYELSKFLILF